MRQSRRLRCVAEARNDPAQCKLGGPQALGERSSGLLAALPCLAGSRLIHFNGVGTELES